MVTRQENAIGIQPGNAMYAVTFAYIHPLTGVLPYDIFYPYASIEGFIGEKIMKLLK